MSSRLLLPLFLAIAVIAAEEPRFGDKDPLTLIPLDAAAYVQVRVKKFLESPVGKQLAEKQPKEIEKLEEATKRFGLKLADVESFSLVWTKMAADGASDGPVFVIVTRQPLDRTKVPKNRAIEVLAPDLFVGGNDAKHIAAYVDLYKKKSKRGVLEPTTRQVMKHHVVIAGIGGDPNIPWLLPQPFDSLKPLGQATSMAFVLQATDGLWLRGIADFPPGTAAEGRDAAGQLPGFAPVFAKNVPTAVPFWRFIVTFIGGMQASTEGQTLRMGSLIPPEGIAAMLAPPINPKVHPKEVENLKTIARAMHNYHDDHQQTFPAHAIYSKDGKPLLSSRVELLPKLGQQELYDKFHRDEAWDSEHNKKLIKEMPEVYLIPRAGPPRDRGLTFCQVFVGPKSAMAEEFRIVRHEEDH